MALRDPEHLQIAVSRVGEFVQSTYFTQVPSDTLQAVFLYLMSIGTSFDEAIETARLQRDAKYVAAMLDIAPPSGLSEAMVAGLSLFLRTGSRPPASQSPVVGSCKWNNCGGDVRIELRDRQLCYVCSIMTQHEVCIDQ